MLYNFLKIISRITVHVFFKKIRINGLENINPGKPLLITANHTNAFIDAIALQVFAKQNIYTLARSDVFNTPFKKWLLGQIRMHPIYRLQEGSDNLHKNAETFDVCNNLLKQKKSIMIFPEGICIQQRRLCKLKKGTARIVFGAEESANFNMDLQVVPVGINYSTPSRFGGTLLINIGERISVSKYLETYKTDKARTINQFTSDLEKEMEKLIISIPKKEHDELVKKIEKLYKADLIAKDKSQKHILEKDFEITTRLTKSIDEAAVNTPDKFNALKENIDSYYSEIKSLRLRDKFIKTEKFKRISSWKVILKSLLLIATFPVFLTGLLFNYLPFKIPYWTSKKIVKEIEFFTSINLGMGMFIFIFYYLIQTSVVFFLFKDIQMLLAFMFIAPASGFFALNYWELYKDIKGMAQVLKYKHDAAKLAEKRKEIVKRMEEILILAQ